MNAPPAARRAVGGGEGDVRRAWSDSRMLVKVTFLYSYGARLGWRVRHGADAASRRSGAAASPGAVARRFWNTSCSYRPTAAHAMGFGPQLKRRIGMKSGTELRKHTQKRIALGVVTGLAAALLVHGAGGLDSAAAQTGAGQGAGAAGHAQHGQHAQHAAHGREVMRARAEIKGEKVSGEAELVEM